MPPVLVHITVVPARTVSFAGVKTKLLASTVVCEPPAISVGVLTVPPHPRSVRARAAVSVCRRFMEPLSRAGKRGRAASVPGPRLRRVVADLDGALHPVG